MRVQTTTLDKQKRLCWNMRAEFLVVPFDSDEVRQIAPPPGEILLWVDPRHEDKTFALDLAAVLLQHVEILATALPGVLIFSQSCRQLALVNLASLLDHKAIVSLPARPDSPATKSELLTQRINSPECVTCGYVPPATSWLLQRFMTYTAELATCSHVSPEHDTYCATRFLIH